MNDDSSVVSFIKLLLYTGVDGYIYIVDIRTIHMAVVCLARAPALVSCPDREDRRAGNKNTPVLQIFSAEQLCAIIPLRDKVA